MSETPPPLPDGNALLSARRRRDRLLRGGLAQGHPLLNHAYRAALDRLADMRLPVGPGLLISPQPLVSAGQRVPSEITELTLADVFPRPREPEQDNGEMQPSVLGHSWMRFYAWVSRQIASTSEGPQGSGAASGSTPFIPRHCPAVSGGFGGIADATQALVIDLGGLAAGWPLKDWLSEMARLLMPGGVYLSINPGPTALAALWSVWGRRLPPSPFWHDLHDLGDAMSHAGLAAPVAESERLGLTYATTSSAWADIRDFPIRPPPMREAPGCLGHQSRSDLWSALESLRGGDGRIALSAEMVLAHAWKPAPRPSAVDGLQAHAIAWHPLPNRQTKNPGGAPASG